MKRTIILILLLVISAVGLLALSLNTNQPPKETVPQSLAETALTLTTPKSNDNTTYSSDILINTNGNKVTAVQLELSYDPQALGNFDITAGTFFKTNSVELLKRIDTDNGKISYALGNGLGQKGVQGQGVVVTLTFTKLKTTGITFINFDPKSLVSAEGIAQSVLRTTLSTKFNLSATTTAIPQGTSFTK